MKYRKKAIEVEAIQLFQSDFDNAFDERKKIEHNISAFIWNLDGKEIWLAETREGKVKASVKTLEGKMGINDGDYLIRGVKDELYPCKPDIFEQTYEEVKPL